MLAHLLRCHEGQAVSLEVLDDIAVTGPGSTTAEQTKSGLAHNPIADRSVDLWKTLFNWVEAIRKGGLALDTRFVLYVAQPHEGKLASELHETTDRPSALNLVIRLRQEYWGDPPRFAKKSGLPNSLARYVNGVLETSDDVLCRLIVGFVLQKGSGSPGDDIRSSLREKAISGGAVENILTHLLGWVKRTVDGLIEKGRPAVITFGEFHKILVAEAKRFDRSNSLVTSPRTISETEVNYELRNRVYIRQLQIINLEDNELVQAVNDYLQASAARTLWSERADVIEPSFEEFRDELERQWASRRRLAQVEHTGRTDLDIGRVVFSKCMEIRPRLQGMDVPGFFAPGSYHALSDGMKVGWHPRYEAELAALRPSASPEDHVRLGRVELDKGQGGRG